MAYFMKVFLFLSLIFFFCSNTLFATDSIQNDEIIIKAKVNSPSDYFSLKETLTELMKQNLIVFTDPSKSTKKKNEMGLVNLEVSDIEIDKTPGMSVGSFSNFANLLEQANFPTKEITSLLNQLKRKMSQI